MTLSKVISLADELCPNALSNDVKTAWINEVEGMVQTEVMLFASAEVITYDYESDKDAQLLVNPPHDKLYLPYLLAMLHFANADFDRYHNTITLFNSHYEEFVRWYADNYRPADVVDEDELLKKFYFSAYGIAIKNGYQGSEREWLQSLIGPKGETGEKGDAGYSVQLRYNEENDSFEWKYTNVDEWQKLCKSSEINIAMTQLKTDVETALRTAENARDKAQSAAYETSGYKIKAQTAQTAAETAQSKAQKAQSAAEQAKTDAETARDIAISRSEIAQSCAEDTQEYYHAISTKAHDVAQKHSEIMNKTENGVPDYWQEHLDNKTATIKALQDGGGKDCFSFVVMTDLHYPSNLGKKSPTLAKYIMDKCGIKYALCLGDVQSRGSYTTKETVKNEFDKIKEMFSPIADKLLQTQGNHDGSWGTAIEGEAYPNNFTPDELYGYVYRNSHLINGVKTDETGTAYYVDHDASNIRYILLNTHCNKYEENPDGSAKYNNMRNFRFTQAQYDFLINDALQTDKKIIVCGHAPIHYEKGYALEWGGEESDVVNTSGDNGLMRTMLDAYNQRMAFNGVFAGTATAISYTNKIPVSTDTDGSIFNGTGYKKDSRMNSSGVVVDLTAGTTPVFTTGFIPVKRGDVVRLENCWIDADGTAEMYGKPPGGLNNGIYDGSKTSIGVINWSAFVEGSNVGVTDVVVDENGNAIQFTWDAYTTTEYIRLTLAGNAENAIVTVNEEIAETSGYDKVVVNTDFSNAKGEIVCYISGHRHIDSVIPINSYHQKTYPIITVRCDGHEDNQSDLYDERVAGTTTEQSFDVFTVNTKTGTIHITKIGAGADRTVEYKS